MNEKPVLIDKNVLISFSVAISLGAGCFIAGTVWEKINKIDSVSIDRRLAKVEILLKLVAGRIGIPPDTLATVTDEELKPSRSSTTDPTPRARLE